MKFIADSMLGRLARWLRLLGHDTLYYPSIEDRLLLKIAREDERVLLTRDTRLVKIRGLHKFLLLKDNDPFKQLKSVIAAFQLQPHNKAEKAEGFFIFSRCAICNAILTTISKEQAKESVPDYVYQTSHIFRQCSGCGKLYWDGTHPGKFREKLSEILS